MHIELIREENFDLESALLALGFEALEKDQTGTLTKAFKRDVTHTRMMFLCLGKETFHVVFDYKPSFQEDRYFYEVFQRNLVQRVGDRLEEWCQCLIPKNKAFLEQLLLHLKFHFRDSGEFLQAVHSQRDEDFDWEGWMQAMGFDAEAGKREQDVHYKKQVDDKIFTIHEDSAEEILGIYEGEKLEHCFYYGYTPDHQDFAEQLLAHCLGLQLQNPAPSIRQILEEIQEQYRQKAPVMLRQTIKAAPETEIKAFEALFGEPLPDDYREFLLYNTIEHQFVSNYECYNLNRVIKTWKGMNELLDKGVFDDGRVEQSKANYKGNYFQKVWWNKKWLPFCQDSSGNLHCIDFDPAEKGQKYQLLDMEVQDGQGPFINPKTNFHHFLLSHLNYLQNNQFTVHEHGIEIDG